MNTLGRAILLQNRANMVYYKSFGRCAMQGKAIEQRIERVQEAIEGYLESLERP